MKRILEFGHRQPVFFIASIGTAAWLHEPWLIAIWFCCWAACDLHHEMTR